MVAIRGNQFYKYGPIKNFDSVTGDHSQNRDDVVNEMIQSAMIDQF